MNVSITRVLVIGASGFIGSEIRRFLKRDERLAVEWSSSSGDDGARRLDLREPETIASALRNVDVVVHAAMGNRAVIVDGMTSLLRAAETAGVRRLISLSSIAVYGGAHGAVTEQTPLVSANGRGYAAWKAAAEQACRQSSIGTVRLRPAIVYGAGSELWVGRLAQRLNAGRWGRFGRGGEGTCNLVHVSDVAAAVSAAIFADGVGGQAFNISGPDSMSWNRWFTMLATAIDAPPLRDIPMPIWKLRSLLSLPAKAVARRRPGFARHWLLGAPSGSELDLFALEATYPSGAAEQQLGWLPRISVAEGLADSVAWLRRREAAHAGAAS